MHVLDCCFLLLLVSQSKADSGRPDSDVEQILLDFSMLGFNQSNDLSGVFAPSKNSWAPVGREGRLRSFLRSQRSFNGVLARSIAVEQ